MSQEKIRLPIRSLGHKGEGVGSASGFVVFVEGALPQETVDVVITERKKRFAKGKLLNIIQESPHRITPPCPVYERCGGCQLQHLSYPEQLKAKTARVKETLSKIAHFNEVHVKDCLPSPDEFHWRHKVQLPAANIDGKVHFGFYEPGSHRVVPISSCLIHVEDGNVLLQLIEKHVNALGIQAFDKQAETGTLRHILLKTSSKSGKTLVILITNGSEKKKMAELAALLIKESQNIAGVILNVNKRLDNVILGPHFETLAGDSFIIEEIARCRFVVSPASFFQVNPGQAENLYKAIVEYAEADSNSTVLDAYCGVGTMAIIMAKEAGNVLGIECVEDAVLDAKKNAALNQADNAAFKTGTLETMNFKGQTFDIVLLNPPRKGCEQEALQKVAALKAKRIIYTSCDPATLARDLAFLAENGYIIDQVQPFDMFPQTMHVETVVSLKLLEN